MVSAILSNVARRVQPPRSAWSPAGQAGRRLRALSALGRKLDSRDPAMVREAATLLTSQLFFAPLLAEARKLPFGQRFGSGGRTEEVFGEQLDLRIADAVARSDRGFTRQLAERLARGPGAAEPRESAARPEPPTRRSIQQNRSQAG